MTCAPVFRELDRLIKAGFGDIPQFLIPLRVLGKNSRPEFGEIILRRVSEVEFCTSKEIADFFGITVKTASSWLSRLQKEELIFKHGTVKLNSRGCLNNIYSIERSR